MSELASEIRRIARGDKVKGPLGNAKERDPINGTFVPFTNTPLNQITDNGAEGVDPVDVNAPASNGAGEDPTDTDNQNDQPTDGNDPNTFNKGSATQGSTSNTYDMEDVIDQTGDVPTAPNEPDYSNSGDYSTGGIIDRLSGATDCTTGQCVNFHTDGNFPAPEGWEDAETPPTIDNNFEEGFQWESTSTGSIGYPTVSQLAEAYFAELSCGGAGQAQCGSFAVVSIGEDEPNATFGTVREVIHSGLTSGGSYFESEFFAIKKACEGENCIESDPDTNDQSWPEDGCYDLALKNGSFQTSQYDSEAPASAGGSKVNFCFGSGRQGTMEVTANGGFMVYETSGAAPTGQANVYGNDGTFQAAGDATDTFMDQWRPK